MKSLLKMHYLRLRFVCSWSCGFLHGGGKEGRKVERRRKEKKGKERAVVITLVGRVGGAVIFHVAGSWEEHPVCPLYLAALRGSEQCLVWYA